ncbi:hypothetical protein SAMN03097699_1883 [Flavobacteriaceae bacterium MAR_2010_188]|nr:hypothetical protein SAMN03097699_1883 [Flavobacteriaceae bacterium MAR_2010_188]
MPFSQQVAYLFLLALPIACISWTVTHEEVFKEPRKYCLRKYKTSPSLLIRKFFYLFTCEYCFSHYITLAFLIMTRYQLLYFDWRGYLIAGFALVWIANIYMSIYGLVRVGLKKEQMDADIEELKLKKKKKGK